MSTTERAYRVGDTVRFDGRDVVGTGVITKAPWIDDEGTWMTVKHDTTGWTHLVNEDEIHLVGPAREEAASVNRAYNAVFGPILYSLPQEAEPRLTSDEFDELTKREPTDDELCNPTQYVPDSRDHNHWTL